VAADLGREPSGAAACPPVELPRSPAIVGLRDPDATDPSLTGAKAANLARAAAEGLPVLPGFVVTTAAPPIDARSDGALLSALRHRWEQLTEHGARALVVRSSSTAEDTEASSMAGQFLSEVDVAGWPRFVEAIGDVQRSASRVHPPDGAPRPMAVLVQPMLRATVGGVLFGLDPVSGDRRHDVVEVVPGGPQSLVDGTAAVDHVTLSRRGRPIRRRSATSTELVRRGQLRRLARLGRQLHQLFGGPQDVEWAIDASERLWLLQSRPVTAAAALPSRGARVFGPGPVGETLPLPLHPLEVDLWVEPLRAGAVQALRTIRAAPLRALTDHEVVIVVEGRVACDLEIFGVNPRRRRLPAVVSPRWATRHLLSAWRVGRLRAALPALGDDLARYVDDELGTVPPAEELDDADLIELLERARALLLSVHGHQILAGSVVPVGDEPSLAGIALRALADGRESGRADADLIAERPVVLALTGPRVGDRAALPELIDPPDGPWDPRDLAALSLRDALRLRARWVQELVAVAAGELGRRLAAAGGLDASDDVRLLRLAELRALVERGVRPRDLPARRAVPHGPPLPAAFRLSDDGAVVPMQPPGPTGRDGLPVGGGRGVGRVVSHRGASPSAEGEVLVVRTLDPQLAPGLPGLAGLVAETGGALSHLAILAREQGVPVVVGVAGAVERFPPGTRLLVDGTTGEVAPVDDAGVDDAGVDG
jgi:pyruvate,water dikinase